MKRQTSIVKTLTYRSFRANKGRNWAAVLAIVLTTTMFTTLFTLAQSMGKNMTEMALRQSGNTAHTTCKQLTEAQVATLGAHPKVTAIGKSIIVALLENEALAGRQTELRYGDATYADIGFALPTTGTMPTASDEIALDTATLQRLGVPQALGQRVTLEWRKDTNTQEITRSDFTLCGWWEGNAAVYASIAWVSEAFALTACNGADAAAPGQICGQRTVSILFPTEKNIDAQGAALLADTGLTQLALTTNLAYSAEMQQSILLESLSLYAGMLLVFLAGYLVIFNVFQISVSGEIQFYGKLKTLGMTTRQIKRMIYGQGNLLCLLGIPVGLGAGYLLGVLLIPALLPSAGASPSVSASPVIFVGSALFAYLTVLSSCFLPARVAGKVSPMEALRYTDAEVACKRKVKKTQRGAALPAMAWANVWRNRKRTLMVLCSLTLGLVLMSFFYAKNISFDVEKYLISLTVADFQLDDATNSAYDGYDPKSQTLSPALLAQIHEAASVEATGRLYSQTAEITLSQQARDNLSTYYTQERLAEFASYDPSFPQWKQVFDKATVGEPLSIEVYGADGLILQAGTSSVYLLDGTYDPVKFATGDYALAIGPAVDPGKNLPTYAIGETVRVAGKSFIIMAVVSPLQPMVAGTGEMFSLPLILPADVFAQLWPEPNLRKYYCDVPPENLAAVTTLLEDYQQASAQGMAITSRQTMVEQYKAQTRSAAVMGYAISITVALVGVLNFVNSMVTAIVSRKKEFAMMQSIGMTKRQLQGMLTLEGLYYAGLTLVASYGVGAFVVGVLVRALTAQGYSTFQFTLLPLVLCTPVLLAFALLVPAVCFRNLEQRSLVERLRNSD